MSLNADPCLDMVTLQMFEAMWSVIVSSAEEGMGMPSAWAVPRLAPEDWWMGLPVGKITVLVGGREILRNDTLIVGAGLKVRLLIFIHTLFLQIASATTIL